MRRTAPDRHGTDAGRVKATLEQRAQRPAAAAGLPLPHCMGAELAERAAARDRIEATPPPRLLGEPEAPPPLDAFPKAMARATAAIMANLRADATPPPAAPADDDPSTVSGIGIGSTTYRGRACVVRDLMLAFDQLEPGDVLVAPFTGPSANSLMPILGALVVEEGGALCHAAIVAREFVSLR